MVEFVQNGDLLKEDVDALVNTVNCVGIMGRGVALQFKNRYPENFKAYAAACKRGEVRPGRMFITDNGLIRPHWIINFPTKRHWRYPSRFVDIEKGLDDLVNQVRSLNIKTFAMPPLGCGLGGLDWRVVRRVIEEKLSPLADVRIRVYEPNDVQVRETLERKAPAMTTGRAVLLVLCDRYIKECMVDFDFTLLALHKLMYFAQVDGQDLRLKYEKAAAGPYATNLRNVLSHIEGYFVTGYNDGGDNPLKILKLVDGAVQAALQFLSTGCEDVLKHIDRVIELAGPNGDAAGLELLSSVHWLFHNEGAKTQEQAVENLWNWNKRKRRFTRAQVGYAFSRLQQFGWI